MSVFLQLIVFYNSHKKDKQTPYHQVYDCKIVKDNEIHLILKNYSVTTKFYFLYSTPK